MKQRIAIIGSGELAKHIAHYAVQDNQYEVVGYFDDFAVVGSMINSHQIIGKLNQVEQFFKEGQFDQLLIGVGYTRMAYRKEVFERFLKIVPFATFIHSSCFVDSNAKIAQGSIIFPRCTIYMGCVIKENVFIQVGSCITDCTIHSHTMISANVTIAGRSEIGKCCNIGVSTTIINDINLCDEVKTGAGAVVTKNISESGLYVGVPAKRISDFK